MGLNEYRTKRRDSKNLDAGVSMKTIIFDQSHPAGWYVYYAATDEGIEQKRFVQLYDTG
jgi:hypothetical protein